MVKELSEVAALNGIAANFSESGRQVLTPILNKNWKM
jgi:hypothetical protein